LRVETGWSREVLGFGKNKNKIGVMINEVGRMTCPFLHME
jgi:hypothetical protein